MRGHVTAWPWVRPVAIAVTVVVLGACGDDAGPDPDVEAACDRLADVADAVLAVRNAQTRAEVRARVEEPYDSFVAAADAAGDNRLAGFAHQARGRFDAYLTATDSLDAREAGDEADIALDRAARRCVQLGATTDFPEEPK